MFKEKYIDYGGTGSFGKNIQKLFYQNIKPNKIIIYCRDELKQFEMLKSLMILYALFYW